MNESLPAKPGSGKYVATPLFNPTEPCAGCEMMHAVRSAGDGCRRRSVADLALGNHADVSLKLKVSQVVVAV